MSGLTIVHSSRSRQGRLSLAGVQRAMQEAFDGAQSRGSAFACLMIQVDDLEVVRRVYGEEQARRNVDSLTRGLERAEGLEGALGYEIEERLLLAIPYEAAAEVDELGRSILELARNLEWQASGHTYSTRISVGLASNHTDEASKMEGLLLETLVMVALEGSEVASNSGGDQFSHTELYGLIQGGFERKEPTRVEAQRARVADLKSLPPGSQPAAPSNFRPVDISAGSASSASAEEGTDSGVSAPEESLSPQPALSSGADTHADAGPGAPIGYEALSELIRAKLAAAGSEQPKEGLERDLTQLVADWASDERERIEQASHGQYLSQIDLLERRISKLSQTLQETEGELLRIARMKNVDLGVASYFRGVQGLEAEEAHFELKKALMTDIYQANVELLKQLQLASGE